MLALNQGAVKGDPWRPRELQVQAGVKRQRAPGSHKKKGLREYLLEGVEKKLGMIKGGTEGLQEKQRAVQEYNAITAYY